MIFVSLISLFSIGFSSFLIVDNQVETEVNIEKSDSSPVCYTKSDGQKYLTIEKGVEVANGRSNETVVVCNDATIKSDLIIESGTTLLLPYDEKEGEFSFVNETVTRKYLVTLSNASTITVEENANLIIGAQLYTTGIKGLYSELTLDKDCNVIVKGNAYFYGKITEKNSVNGFSVSDKIYYDNKTDLTRYLKISSTGFLKTAFATYDMGGSGSAITNKIDAGICPTYKFEFPCLSTYVSCEYGSRIDILAYITTGMANQSAEATLICPYYKESELHSMFYVENGAINLEYCENHKTIIYVDGSVKMGSLYINKGIELDTTEMFVPISSYFYIYIKGSFDTNDKNIKFLPGSHLCILDNSDFLISGTSENDLSQVVFYQGDTLTSIGITEYGNTDSICINNGNIILNEYGAIAGNIITENISGNASIDLSVIERNTQLSISVKEGDTGEKNTPLLRLTGNFYINDENMNFSQFGQFKYGDIYYSYEGFALWEGVPVNLVKININVEKVNSKNSSYSFSVYVNESTQGVGTELYKNVSDLKELEFFVEAGNYVKIIDETCDYITVNSVSYSSGERIMVEDVLDFRIHPLEAFVVTCNHTHGNSGAGGIKRTIYYGESRTNLGFTKGVSNGSPVSVSIPKGWFFRVEDDANVRGESKVIKTTYDNDGNKTEEILSTAKGEIARDQNYIYTADGDYLFTSDNVTCLMPGTLIAMADGTVMPIEKLKLGDVVKSYNFMSGRFENQKIVLYKEIYNKFTEKITLIFEDNSCIEISQYQSFFDLDTLEYFTISASNMFESIGKRILTYDNSVVSEKTIKNVNFEIVSSLVYELVTSYTYNCVANNVVTADPFIGGINIFKVNEGLRYDENSLLEDINKYGLYTYNTFKDYIEPYQFELYNFKYLKIAVGKGLFDFDFIINCINEFKKYSI